MLRNICAGLVTAALLTGGIGSVVKAEPAYVPTLADMSVQVKEPSAHEQELAKQLGENVTASPAATAEEPSSPRTETAAPGQQAEPAAAPEAEKKELERKISINLAARSLALFEGTEKIRLYPIGPGTVNTPTPVGYYKIRSKDVNPSWINPKNGEVIPSGPDCPLGYRWMQIQGNYGIHGTNKPDSIGHYVSNGCIRMQEEDVEALFDLVKIGTPVEITYNRVVVEKLPDNTVAYYIYPDGYGWQKITVDDVNKWLAGYGVANFVDNEEIAAKIEASDGEPTYVAQVYPLYVNGEKLKNKAVVYNGVTYLPAIDLAEAVHVDLGWNEKTRKLVSTLGVADGVDKKDVLYCKLEGAAALFKLTGQLEKGSFVMKYTSNNQPAKPAVEKTNDPVLQEMSQEKTAQNPKTAKVAKPARDAEKPAVKDADNKRHKHREVNIDN